ncbi:hypothetical protein [Mesotoga prima]|uniref:hypothetical protein n=1 Tax=Mesotoga prima TaxID=1184387 RepID=UPI002FD995A3
MDKTIDIDMDLILEIKSKVKIAEDYINHNFEGITNSGHVPEGIDIPSMNELRYALNHLLRYLSGEKDHGHRALKHARRAIYDCYETEALYLFANYRQFESENQDIILIDIFKDYLLWARRFLELKEFISNTPKDNRDEYYENLEAMLFNMRPFYYESRIARQEILKMRAEKEKNEREKNDALEIAQKTIKIRTIALTLSTLGLLVAIVGLYIQSLH